MNKHNKSRSSFSSAKLVTCWPAAGASVGTWKYSGVFSLPRSKIRRRNFSSSFISCWRSPFGYSMIVAESAIGCMTRKSPVGDSRSANRKWLLRRGWDQRCIPILDRSILLCHRRMGHQISDRIREGATVPCSQRTAIFPASSQNGVSTELCFAVFCLITVAIIYGVRETALNAFPGDDADSDRRCVIIAVYSVTRPGALAGVESISLFRTSKTFHGCPLLPPWDRCSTPSRLRWVF